MKYCLFTGQRENTVLVCAQLKCNETTNLRCRGYIWWPTYKNIYFTEFKLENCKIQLLFQLYIYSVSVWPEPMCFWIHIVWKMTQMLRLLWPPAGIWKLCHKMWPNADKIKPCFTIFHFCAEIHWILDLIIQVCLARFEIEMQHTYRKALGGSW